MTTLTPLPATDLAARLHAEAASAAAYAEDSLAPNTRLAYASAWRQWCAFCEARNFDPYGPRGQVAIYLAAMADGGSKVSSIAVTLSAIVKAYTARNLPSPMDDPAVQLVYRGIRRRVGVAPEQVEAILPDQLRAMLAAMPAPEGHYRLRVLRNRALLVLGWVGALRRSELIGLDVDDVAVVPEGLRVTLRRSKTDQEGRGRVVALPYGAWLPTCPVRQLQAWSDAAAVTDGALFRGITHDGMSLRADALSTRQAANIVQQAAKAAGLSGHFSGHSLRAGFVTSAVRAGKSLKSVQNQTGHATVAMLMRYVREQELFADNAAAGLV